MLYKYVGAENGKQALEVLKYFCEAYTLKASEPTSFNDPFEFKIVADFEATPAESNPKTDTRANIWAIVGSMRLPRLTPPPLGTHCSV
jgi:hypothetical protein